MNKIDKNKKTVITIISIVLLLQIISMIIAFTSFSIIKNDKNLDNRRVINPDKFVNILTKEGCKVENKKNIINTSIYYQIKEESCDYDATYVIIDDEKEVKSIVDELYNKRKSSENIKFDNHEVLKYGLNKRVFGDQDYNVVLYNKTMVLYLKTGINNKKEAINLLTELGLKRGYLN